jgi:hypothetical protein
MKTRGKPHHIKKEQKNRHRTSSKHNNSSNPEKKVRFYTNPTKRGLPGGKKKGASKENEIKEKLLAQ